MARVRARVRAREDGQGRWPGKMVRVRASMVRERAMSQCHHDDGYLMLGYSNISAIILPTTSAMGIPDLSVYGHRGVV